VSTEKTGRNDIAPKRIPSPAEVVAALFGDMPYGRRRRLKPHGTPLPKSFKPPRPRRRFWAPLTRA